MNDIEKEFKPKKIWQMHWQSMEDYALLAEEGYLPSDKLDEDAEEIIEDYDV